MSKLGQIFKVLITILVLAFISFLLYQGYYFVKNFFSPATISLNQEVTVEYSLNDTYDSLDYSYTQLIITAYGDENKTSDILLKFTFYNEGGTADGGLYYYSTDNGEGWYQIASRSTYVFFSGGSNIYRIPVKDFSKTTITKIWSESSIVSNNYEEGSYSISSSITLQSPNIQIKNNSTWEKPYFTFSSFTINFDSVDISINYDLGKIVANSENIDITASDLISYTISSTDEPALFTGHNINSIYASDPKVYVYVYVPNNPNFIVNDIILNSDQHLTFEKIIPENYITHYKASFDNLQDGFNLEIITSNEVVLEYSDELDTDASNFEFAINTDSVGTKYAEVRDYNGISKNIQIPAMCEIEGNQYYVRVLDFIQENNFVETISFNSAFNPLLNATQIILNWSALKKVDTSNINEFFLTLNTKNLTSLEIYSSYYSDLCYKDIKIVSANFYEYRDLATYMSTLSSSGIKIYMTENFLNSIIQRYFEFSVSHDCHYVNYYYEGTEEEFRNIISYSHSSVLIQSLFDTTSYNNYCTFNFNSIPLTDAELLSARAETDSTIMFDLTINDETSSFIRISQKGSTDIITAGSDVFQNGYRYIFEIFIPYNSTISIILDNATLSINGRIINDEEMNPIKKVYVYFIDFNENSADVNLQISYPN